VSRPRERSTAGPVSYTWVARSRSESTSQFTASALNKPSSSSSSSSSSSFFLHLPVQQSASRRSAQPIQAPVLTYLLSFVIVRCRCRGISQTEQSLYDCSCDVTIFMPYNGMSHHNISQTLDGQGAQHQRQRQSVEQHIPTMAPSESWPPGASVGGGRVHLLAVSSLSEAWMSIT